MTKVGAVHYDRERREREGNFTEAGSVTEREGGEEARRIPKVLVSSLSTSYTRWDRRIPTSCIVEGSTRSCRSWCSFAICNSSAAIWFAVSAPTWQVWWTHTPKMQEWMMWWALFDSSLMGGIFLGFSVLGFASLRSCCLGCSISGEFRFWVVAGKARMKTYIKSLGS